MAGAAADAECVAFLQWALPQLGRRWEGYRKVRRRVCLRISRRAVELNLGSLTRYRDHLQENPGEWAVLDALVDVTISRFYRDRSVFDFVQHTVFPLLVERARRTGSPSIRVWSAGCANGEEPYTIALIWLFSIAPQAGLLQLEVLGTDIKSSVLRRAREARFPRSSVRDLPDHWREAAFDREDDELVLRTGFRGNVTFVQHDIRLEPPREPSGFDLIVCRYQAFTYFDEEGQRDTTDKLSQVTSPGAVLVLGRRESPPVNDTRFRPVAESLGVFERCD